MEAEQTQITNQAVLQSNSAEGQPSGQQPNQPQDKIASKMEILLRRERAALDAETRAKALQAEVDAKLAKYQEFEAAKEKPLDALKLLGLDYNELSQTVLNEGNIPPEVLIKRMKEEIDGLRSEMTEKEKRQAEQAAESAKKQADQAVSNFKKQIDTYLGDNKTKYELIHFDGVSSDKLYQIIEDHWNETLDDQGVGKILPIEEAADKIEKQLEEKYMKAKDIPKFNSIFQMTKGNAGQQMMRQIQEQQKATGLKTLTNNLTPAPNSKKVLTDEDRIQKAIAYAKGLRS